MRGKWFIAVVAILITVLGVYQLSYTFKANELEEEATVEANYLAEEYINSHPGENLDSITKVYRKEYIDSLWETEVYFGRTFKKVKQYALNLGLDLQGGTHVTVIVSPDNILTKLSGDSEDEDFVQAVKNAKESMKTEQGKFTDLFYSEWKKVATDRQLNEIFATEDNGNITLETTDSEILELLDKELDGAIDRSITILRSRIDKFGATNPIIHPVKSTGRIEIELPGLDDEERIRNQVETVAHLEFLKLYEGQQLQGTINNIRILLASEEKAQLKAEGDTVVDSTFVSNFDNKFMRGPIKKSDRDEFYQIFARKDIQALMPGDLTFMLSSDVQFFDREKTIQGLRLYPVVKGPEVDALLEGDKVANSYPSQDGNGGLGISIVFDADGASAWSNITRENINKPIAIVLDNEVYSAPVIQEQMNTGNCIITTPGGGFSGTEASELSGILKSGRLPATPIIERLVKVGPSMGAQAVSQGLMSLLVGLGLVILFMIIYYGKGGIVANVALIFNIFFIVGILATPNFAVTLTLPGIAGIVLTIGMSIDANVLIFERIREELAVGKSKEASVQSGYAKAFWTIFDANLTTFLSALVLYIFGTGLVKGFAVTLMVGVVCSFFAAVFITRLIVQLMGEKNNFEKLNFSSALANKLSAKRNIDFIGKRKIGYIFSAVVIAIGIGLMATKGLNLGVALKGGFSYVYKFDQSVDPEAIKKAVKEKIGESEVQVKTYDVPSQVSITTSFMVDSDDKDVAKTVKDVVESGLVSFGKAEQLQSNQVGATIADDIKTTARNSVIIALIVIFFYIIIRFRKWQFGLGSLLALFHDVLFVLSIFAIAGVIGFSFEIDEVFIAAILTLVGYSINDTVVVFDRVREYLTGDSKDDMKTTLNNSLNSTLSRTLITSITTLLVVIVLLVFGGEALRGFSFALFIGVLIGTYSSIFIATPTVYDLSGNKEEK